MPIKSLYIIAVTFIALIIIAIYSFINPGIQELEYDVCDFNQDRVVESGEIWQCYREGKVESTQLESLSL